MGESKLELRDIYDNAILQGNVEGAEITKRCDAKIRMDGSTELTVRPFCAQSACRFVELLGEGDPYVAYAIASILYTSTIVYGKIGEAFLREKLQESGENFSLEEYCHAVAETVIRNYNNSSRKQKIIDGIKAAMSDAVNVEANAAKAAIMKHEYWGERAFEKGTAIGEAFLKGEFIAYAPVYEKMIQAKYGEIDEATALKNLNIVYQYLKIKMSEIKPVYSKVICPEVSNAKLLAYYIAWLGWEEIERVKELSLKDKIKSANHVLEVVYNEHYIADGPSDEQSDDIIEEGKACYTFEELYEKKRFYVKELEISTSFKLSEDGDIVGIVIADRFYVDFDGPCILEHTKKIYEHRDGYLRITIRLVPKS